MRKYAAGCAVLLLLLSGNAFSQVSAYLGLSGGVSSQRLDLEGVDLDRDTTFVYGLQGGIEILMLGLEVQYLQASHNLELADFPEIGWGDRVVDFNYLGFNAKVHFFSTVVRPYLAVGYGYYRLKLKDLDKDTATNLNFGLGLDLKLGRHFSLRGEGKYHPSSVVLDAEDVEVKNFTFVGGMNFYF